MKRLHIIIITFITLAIVNNSYGQDKDKYIESLEKNVASLEKDVERLKKAQKVFEDTITAKANRIQLLKQDKNKLTIDFASLKSRYESLENEKNELDKKVEDYNVKVQKIENLRERIKEDSITIEKQKSAIKTASNEKYRKLEKLEKEHNELKEDFDSKSTEFDKLEEKFNAKSTAFDKLKEKFNAKSTAFDKLNNDFTLTKRNNTELTEIIENNKTNIENLTTQIGELTKANQQKEEALKEFAVFRDEAIKTVKTEIPKLVRSSNFYNSKTLIADYEKKINILKIVIGQDDKELNSLAQQLQKFKKTTEILIDSKSILNVAYNDIKVNNAIKNLENYTYSENSNFSKEKTQIIKLLKSYCVAYKDTYDFFQSLKQYDRQNEKDREKNIINYTGYFRLYTIQDVTIQGRKEFIKVYDNYPYIQKTLDKRLREPKAKSNPNNSLPEVNLSCN